MTVFFHTSPFANDPQHGAQRKITLLEATNDTLELVKAAQAAARAVWRDGFRYSKAGLFTTDLVTIDKSQRALFGGNPDRGERLMAALDQVNTKYGRGTLFPAATGIQRPWSTKFDMRSPRYTTNVKELPIVCADRHLESRRDEAPMSGYCPERISSLATGVSAVKRRLLRKTPGLPDPVFSGDHRRS